METVAMPSSVIASAAPALARGPVPPAVFARVAERLSHLLERWQRRLAPAPAYLVDMLTSRQITARAVTAAVALGIPDALERPQTLEALASATATQPDPLARLLRVLV